MRWQRARAVRRSVLALAGFLFLIGPPAAATEAGTIEASAWSPVTPVAANPPAGGGETGPTSGGTVFVSATGGTEAARAFVSIGHGTIGDLQSLRLVLPESGQSLDAATAVVQACPSTPLASEDDPQPAGSPEVDCDAASAVGVRADDGTWTFDLTPIAVTWSDETVHTVALVPVPADPTSNYTVAYSAEDGQVEIERAPSPNASGSTERSLSPVVAPPARAPEPAPAFPTGPSSLPTSSATPPTTSAAAPSVGGEQTPTPETPTLSREPAEIASVNSPPTALVLTLVLVLAVALLVARGWRPATALGQLEQGGQLAPGARLGLGLTGIAMLFLAPTVMSEVQVFELGLVLIFFTAAVGLHVLVNWAGELSLAHAGLVGLPAFVVAKIATDHGVSPIVLVPLGITVGVVAGAIIALPALRTSGLYVAVSTLAAGIALDRFFFTRDWLVASRSDVPTPSFLGASFTTTTSLYPVIVVLFALGLAAALVLHRSQLARGMMWMRVDRTAAAAFGIAVDRRRVLAFAIAGAYAGLAGGMTFTWTALATPSMFPLTLAFTYLAAVVVAGPGGLGGLVVATAMLEGGRLFVPGSEDVALYAGPIALMLVLTRFPSGINGLGRFLMKKISNVDMNGHAQSSTTTQSGESPRPQLTTSFAAGVVAIAAGFMSIVVAWYHTGNTDQLWIQTQEFLLGGLGGLGLIIVGATLLIRDALLRLARAPEATRGQDNGAVRPSRRPLRAERDPAVRSEVST